MRVRTIRTHRHAGIERDGSAGAVYEVDEATGRNLIASGYVVDADARAVYDPREETVAQFERRKTSSKASSKRKRKAG